MTSSRVDGQTVALALQGGGSLGAYSWGVLDALLEDRRLRIEGVTGTSAGAINAAALAIGLSTGGPAGAREVLRAFWETLADAAGRRRLSSMDPARWLWRNVRRLTSADAFYELTARVATNFQVDPVTMEPLRSTLDATLDYTCLASPDAVRVFVNATNIRTGQPRVFAGAEVTTDAICASSAVPLLFRPVSIDGEHYWDGALLGNPLIYPVIYGCTAADVVLVETRLGSPEGVPRTAGDVITRSIELASAAGLVRELRMVEFMTRLLEEGPRPGHRKIRLHTISTPPALGAMPDARMFRADAGFFRQLWELGRARGLEWLASEAFATS